MKITLDDGQLNVDAVRAMWEQPKLASLEDVLTAVIYFMDDIGRDGYIGHDGYINYDRISAAGMLRYLCNVAISELPSEDRSEAMEGAIYDTI